MKPVYLIALVLLFPGGRLQAAKAHQLSDFAGRYTGSSTLYFNGTTYSGPAITVFNATKTAKGATLTVSSTASNGGSEFSTGNSYRFVKDKTVPITHIAPPQSDQGIVGSYALGSEIVATASSGSVADGDDLSVTVTVSMKQTKKRATLTVVHSAVQRGIEVYRAVYIGTRLLRKK